METMSSLISRIGEELRSPELAERIKIMFRTKRALQKKRFIDLTIISIYENQDKVITVRGIMDYMREKFGVNPTELTIRQYVLKLFRVGFLEPVARNKFRATRFFRETFNNKGLDLSLIHI